MIFSKLLLLLFCFSHVYLFQLWDLSNLSGNWLDVLYEETGGLEYPGITNPFHYIATKRSSFACHLEDMNLFACSYLQAGFPKLW
jgi:hypothetical protein